MTTGFRSSYGGSELDLDQIFDYSQPGVAGSTGFIAGYDGAGQDLATLFTARSKGADIGYNTGFIALDGRDLREWFAKAGSVVTDYWIGTVTIANANAGQFYGVYWSGSQFYWGSYTKTGGSATLFGLQYEPGYSLGARTWATVNDGTDLPGAPGYINVTIDGLTTQMFRDSPGTYWCSGDFYNLTGKVGWTVNARLYPV